VEASGPTSGCSRNSSRRSSTGTRRHPGFFTPDATWSGGTAGSVTGGKNVAGLFDGSAAGIPDEHVTLDDTFYLSQGKVASITGRRLLDRDPLRCPGRSVQ
jgi:hypothetical protein